MGLPGMGAGARVAGAVASALLAGACSAIVAGLDLGGDLPERFVGAVAGGQVDAAYALLCPSTRFGIPPDAFRRALDANPVLLAATDVTIQRYESGGGLAAVQKGWIAGSAGAADAQFHLSKIDATWCLTGIEIGGTPALPVPGTATAGESARDAGAAVDRARLPAALRNDAYRLYGLSSGGTRRYRMSDGSGAGAVGSQRSELLAIDGGSARFRIVRTGALAALGSLEVVLDADGVHLVGSSNGALAAPALVMPARLAAGTTWRSEYVETPPGGTPVRYGGNDVVDGPERVRTPAGEFDAVRVSTTASVESGSDRATLRLRAWYVADIGSVRVESESTPTQGEPSRIVVELESAGP